MQGIVELLGPAGRILVAVPGQDAPIEAKLGVDPERWPKNLHRGTAVVVDPDTQEITDPSLTPDPQ